jgi:serine/threonine protein kinase
MGILHLDIKADNVLLTGNMGNLTATLSDFGISIYVDDAKKGKRIKGVRVTIDYRAPEVLEYNLDGYMYNSAVDVWSLGILLLYTLSQQNIYYIKDEWTIPVVEEQLNALFRKENIRKTITSKLSSLSPQYKGRAIDLLIDILSISPTERITLNNLIKGNLFTDIKVEGIEGVIEPERQPSLPETIPCVKYISGLCFSLDKRLRVETLFLAIDLLFRCSKILKTTKDPNEDNLESNTVNIVIAATCIFMAIDIVDTDLLPTTDSLAFTSNAKYPNYKINGKDIINEQVRIIRILEGILYRRYLYHACKSKRQLTVTYNDILLSVEYTLVDIPRWIESISYPSEEIESKEITLNEFFISK